MPIISKETWDKIDPREKEKIIQEYQSDKQYEGESYYEGSVNTFEQIFGKENLQPKKLTYEDVARELFEYDGIDDNSHFATIPCLGMKWDNKLQAIGRLLVVAKFLNKDWKPDWENNDRKWYIFINEDNQICFGCLHKQRGMDVYFRTEELAKQAIQILGKDTVRLALGDY